MLLILSVADPVLLEGAADGENGGANPGRVALLLTGAHAGCNILTL